MVARSYRGPSWVAVLLPSRKPGGLLFSINRPVLHQHQRTRIAASDIIRAFWPRSPGSANPAMRRRASGKTGPKTGGILLAFRSTGSLTLEMRIHRPPGQSWRLRLRIRSTAGRWATRKIPFKELRPVEKKLGPYRFRRYTPERLQFWETKRPGRSRPSVTLVLSPPRLYLESKMKPGKKGKKAAKGKAARTAGSEGKGGKAVKPKRVGKPKGGGRQGD